MTRQPEFYKRIFQQNIKNQFGKIPSKFPVPISNAKETVETEFHPYYPILEYQQDDPNSCCFSSLASASHEPVELVSEKAITWRIK